MLVPLFAFNTRGQPGRAMDDDDRHKERRRIILVLVLWPIWAAVWLLV